LCCSETVFLKKIVLQALVPDVNLEIAPFKNSKVTKRRKLKKNLASSYNLKGA